MTPAYIVAAYGIAALTLLLYLWRLRRRLRELEADVREHVAPHTPETLIAR